MFFIAGVIRRDVKRAPHRRLKESVCRMARQLSHRNTARHYTEGKNFCFVSSNSSKVTPADNIILQVAYAGNFNDVSVLRRKLQLKNKRYSAADLLTKSYEKYGKDFARYLSGQFAIALYDNRNNVTLLARDKIGLQPLYYLFDDEYLYFASEIKALLLYSRHRSINPKSLHANILFGATYSKEQLFEGIYELRPGEVFVFSQTQKPETKKYWDIQFRESHHTLSFYQKQFRSLLREAVERRLPVGASKVGLALSGGVDSTVILAHLRKQFKGTVETYTVRYRRFPGEHEEAQRVAKHFGARHHDVCVSSDAVEYFPKVIWHLNDIITFTPLLGLLVYLIGQEVRKNHCGHIFTGNGTELILDANHPGRELYLRRYHAAGVPERFQKAFPKNIRKEFFANIPPLKAFNNIEDMYVKFYASWWGNENLLKEHYTKDFLAKIKSYRARSILSEHLKHCQDTDYFNKILYIDLKTWNARRNLITNERLLSAFGLSSQIPLIDSDLVDFCATIPAGIKYQPFDDKFFFRETYKDILPKEILKKGKRPSGLPDNILEDKIDVILHFVELFKKRNIFKVSYLEKTMRDIRFGQCQPYFLLNFFIMELWFKIFVDRPDIKKEDLTLDGLA